MAHLSMNDLIIVLSGLRKLAERVKQMQNILPAKYDYYQEQYENVARIYDIFKDAQGRVYRSDNLSARINIKLN